MDGQMVIGSAESTTPIFDAGPLLKWLGFGLVSLFSGVSVLMAAALNGWESLVPFVLFGWIIAFLLHTMLRGVRRVEVRAEGVVLRPILGSEAFAMWSEITRVRQTWVHGGVTKQLYIWFQGSRYSISSSHFRDSDTLIAMILEVVGADRIDRTKGSFFQRVLDTGYVPKREEERRVFTSQERRLMSIVAVIGAAIPMVILLVLSLADR